MSDSVPMKGETKYSKVAERDDMGKERLVKNMQ